MNEYERRAVIVFCLGLCFFLLQNCANIKADYRGVSEKITTIWGLVGPGRAGKGVSELSGSSKQETGYTS